LASVVAVSAFISVIVSLWASFIAALSTDNHARQYILFSASPTFIRHSHIPKTKKSPLDSGVLVSRLLTERFKCRFNKSPEI